MLRSPVILEEAMKRLGVLVAMLLSLVSMVSSQTRVYEYGSNPYLSTELYPQDFSLLPANRLSFFPAYRRDPWWGDVDEPGNKPKPTYTTTGARVVDGEASFEHSGKIHTSANDLGYRYALPKSWIMDLSADYTVDALRDDAQGYLSNDVSGGHIPFEYSLNHTVNTFDVQAAFAGRLLNVPVGFVVGGGVRNTISLNQELAYETAQSSGTSDRMLWGWSTSGCNHIFVSQSAEGDAYYQDHYTKGPEYKLNFQLGASLPRVRFGGKIIYRTANREEYRWNADTTAGTELERHFRGEYVQNDWMKRSREALAEVVGNLVLREGTRYSLNTFMKLGFNGGTAVRVLKDNPNAEGSGSNEFRTINVEIDPNVNLKLGEGLHYIDLALIASYTYTRYNNLVDRWVGGGREEIYSRGSVSDGDEGAWERFSYANRNAFDIGLDLSSMFPLLERGPHHLAWGLMLFAGSKFVGTTKYFGDSESNGSSLSFSLHNRRENFDRVITFNSRLMLQYARGPLMLRLDATEPVLQSLISRTRITDADGKNAQYERESAPLWSSPQGMRIGLYVSYEMLFPFLKSYR